MTLLHRRLTKSDLLELITTAPTETVHLSDEHRASLSTRFRAVSVPGHRRLDAWGVERAGRAGSTFRWSPASARRVLGNASLRRMTTRPVSVRDAVRDELGDQMLRATSGYSRSGSLSHWLASAPHPVIGLVTAEAVNWATQLQEIAQWLEVPWEVASSDAYYDVASARTTLRARRDLIVRAEETRTIVRVRSWVAGQERGTGAARRPHDRSAGRPRRRRAGALRRALARRRRLSLGRRHDERPAQRRARPGSHGRRAATEWSAARRPRY